MKKNETQSNINRGENILFSAILFKTKNDSIKLTYIIVSGTFLAFLLVILDEITNIFGINTIINNVLLLIILLSFFLYYYCWSIFGIRGEKVFVTDKRIFSSVKSLEDENQVFLSDICKVKFIHGSVFRVICESNKNKTFDPTLFPFWKNRRTLFLTRNNRQFWINNWGDGEKILDYIMPEARPTANGRRQERSYKGGMVSNRGHYIPSFTVIFFPIFIDPFINNCRKI